MRLGRPRPTRRILEALSQRGEALPSAVCYWGWRSRHGRRLRPLRRPRLARPLPRHRRGRVARALPRAALVHDDLIDNSDTRRSAPSAHRLFERLHGESAGSATASSSAAPRRSCSATSSRLERRAARRGSRAPRTACGRPRGQVEFMRMRTEVTAGQYLDVLEEHAWIAQPDEEQQLAPSGSSSTRPRSTASRRPSRSAPRSAARRPSRRPRSALTGCRSGIAYQLRDDLLGVYGGPELTGKPAGDDLREGKRTMLIAIARERLAPSTRRLLDELLGDQSSTTPQVRMLQQTLSDCGAVDEIEALITVSCRPRPRRSRRPP
ncbi:polyprenyl synthetase family protein [Agromyces mediolanus]|uniref:polyprenyl synthetase family protein n=1 Tax=Agromyces mediolanus TaxID=41986 RepID=UPI00360D82AA